MSNVRLVYDGGGEVYWPPEMGTPRSDQLQGTSAEKLCELAGRVSYDSLGKGRASADYHKHIAEVGHYSTVEHFNFTVSLPWEGLERDRALMACVNRPGLWVDWNAARLRLTANLRTVLEWGSLGGGDGHATRERDLIGLALRYFGSHAAPAIISQTTPPDGLAVDFIAASALREPATDREKWLTLWLRGSRGFSHELVRHGDWTAISQRSTRYVDESESPWVEHPLVTAFLKENPVAFLRYGNANDGCTASFQLSSIHSACGFTYRGLVQLLQPWLESRGVDKVSARKQARGAARGYLGNALETELIFSASVSQWRHMLRMRASNAADAEIRAVFCEALPLLKASRYGDSFKDLELGPASDGIGLALLDGGAA